MKVQVLYVSGTGNTEKLRKASTVQSLKPQRILNAWTPALRNAVQTHIL